MTAETGVINKQGIVLAADSAVTINGQKVHNTSNKLFTLDSMHYVGIMTYGNAEFMGVPWAIIIHQFSHSLEACRLKSVKEYKQRFVDFIRQNKQLQSQEGYNQLIVFYVRELLQIVVDDFKRKIQVAEARNNEEDIKSFLKDELISLIQKNEQSFIDSVVTKDYEFEQFDVAHSDLISYIISNDDSVALFSNKNKHWMSDEVFVAFKKLVFYYITTAKRMGIEAGIVIAGYGEEQSFPELESVVVYGDIDGHLVYQDDVDAIVGPFNSTDGKISTAGIYPFAQSDVVATVINGIAPQLVDKLALILDEEKVDKQKQDSILKKLSYFQTSSFISPMIDSIESLSISELAEVAETFVNVTSFKRKYTSDLATVGGPIDILAITYSEGPIWIKQKHYFDIDKNIDFELRRQKNV